MTARFVSPLPIPVSPPDQKTAPSARPKGFAPLLARCAVAAVSLWFGVQVALAQSGANPVTILFVGNSYTYGYLSTAQTYNTSNVTDENGTGYGGVPGIFKEFTVERGLNYDVHIEAVGGQTLQYHLENKNAIIGQAKWDVVVLQGLSTEATIQGASASPGYTTGNRPTFVGKAQQLEQLVHGFNPAAKLFLYETWSRADLTYQPNGPYYGQVIEAMGNEVHNGYTQAFGNDPNFIALVPAGDAWLRAIRQGVAVRNPYDPTDLASGRLNFWAADSYHASSYGYYLNALLMFGRITGQDPRVLGGNEIAAAALNISPTEATALQSLAYAQLHAPLPGVASRKMHGPAGVFDLPLSLSGQQTIESRSPDSTSGGYQIIFTFSQTLTTAGNAAVNQGSATAATPVLGPEPNQVTVNLAAVSDAQHLVVSLSGVQDGSKVTVFNPVSAAMDVLVGDSSSDGSVNAADIAQVKSLSGQSTNVSNYRADLNSDGVINAADISLAKSRSGNGLPPAPATSSNSAR